MTLGGRIRQARKAQGITQAALAAAIGITRNAVSFWESNTTRPSTERLQTVAAALKANFSWLAMGETPYKGRHDGRINILGIDVAGIIESRTWRPNGASMERAPIPLPLDKRYPTAHQKAWRVQGPSELNWGIEPGAYVVTACYEKWTAVYGGPEDNVLVVARRGRLDDTEREYSVRKIVIEGQNLRLLASSETDQPLTVPIEPDPSETATVKIVGPIIAVYKQY